MEGRVQDGCVLSIRRSRLAARPQNLMICVCYACKAPWHVVFTFSSLFWLHKHGGTVAHTAEERQV